MFLSKYYSPREVADMCEMTVQHTAAMLIRLYHYGKVERKEKRIKKFSNIYIHFHVYRSKTSESIAELVLREAGIR